MTYVFTRKLTVRGRDEATVKIGTPIYEGEGKDFSCSYRIEGLSKTINRSVVGIDAIQAFLMAIRLADVDLSVSTEAKSGELAWLGGPDLGFRLQG